MNYKKLLHRLLFPHFAFLLILLPVSTVFMVYSMVFLGNSSAVTIVSYLISAYNLTIWCLKIPKTIAFFKNFKSRNKYAKRWSEDTHLRINVSLYGAMLWNTAYAVFQLGLGFYHSSFWFFSLAGYYISLATMRFFLFRHTSRHKPGEEMLQELRKYRSCGIVFCLLNLALSLMIFFMIYWNRTFRHHEITTIAMAVYTFTSLTLSIIDMIRYRKFGSPVYSASKSISLAAACVSMITLESTMLTTFSTADANPLLRRILLISSGAVISILIITMAIYMIVTGNKRIKLLKTSKE